MTETRGIASAFVEKCEGRRDGGRPAKDEQRQSERCFPPARRIDRRLLVDRAHQVILPVEGRAAEALLRQLKQVLQAFLILALLRPVLAQAGDAPEGAR